MASFPDFIIHREKYKVFPISFYVPGPAPKLPYFGQTITIFISFNNFRITKKKIDENRFVVWMYYFRNKAVSFKDVLFFVAKQVLKGIADVSEFFLVTAKIKTNQRIRVIKDRRKS